MKCALQQVIIKVFDLQVLTACVAVCSAQGFYGLQSHPNGAVTPIDEPAVAAARADHLATKFGAGLGYAGYAPGYAAGYGYSGPLNMNRNLVDYPNGAKVPADEPAVAAARAAHLNAKAGAAASAPAISTVLLSLPSIPGSPSQTSPSYCSSQLTLTLLTVILQLTFPHL